MADSSSYSSSYPSANDNLQFDTISDSDKYNAIIPILNLTSSVTVEQRNGYRVTARCLRGIGKVDNISSLLSRSPGDSKEFHLYFPPAPFFRPKSNDDTNNTMNKVLLKLHKKPSTQQSTKYAVSIYRVPIVSLDSNKLREPALLLDTQRVNDDFSGWLHFDLSHFYLSSHVYDKLVNSLIVVNATDTNSNPVDMSGIFTPTDCDVDSSEDADATLQPTLELKRKDHS